MSRWRRRGDACWSCCTTSCIAWAIKSGTEILVIVQQLEQEQSCGMPRAFCSTDARHWESGRVLETWSYRWAAEIFHEAGKQVTGLEAGSGTQEGSGPTPLPLEWCSAVAGPAGSGFRRGNGKVCVRQGAITVGQQVHTVAREALYRRSMY